MRLLFTFLLALAVSVASLAVAEPQHFSSGEQPTYLVELYTSEGCSSCPPADLWLTQFKARPDLWSAYIPIAFHVDYWDYLGWEDRFSSTANSRRQSRYQRQGGVRAVYTPGFVINGEEWRGFFHGAPELDAALADEKVGKLSLTIDGDSFEARFTEPSGALMANPYELTIALLGMGLRTEVKRGENRNRELVHDFVMLDQRSFKGESGSWKGRIEFYLNEPAPAYALVAWVSAPKLQAPVQAIGGWFKPENIRMM